MHIQLIKEDKKAITCTHTQIQNTYTYVNVHTTHTCQHTV